MNDHVSKPVDPEQLIRTLNRWLKPGREGIMADREATSPSAIEPVLPDGQLPDRLGPFDVAAALRRVNGKAPLLRKLIISFARTYASAAQDIRVRLAAGEIAEARRLAHSLKGVAGSLELHELQASAGEVEACLAQEDTGQLEAGLSALELALAAAAAAARSLAEVPEIEPEMPRADADGGASVEEAREALRGLLLRRSLGARGAFDRMARSMGLTESEHAAHPLYEALQRLDYARALVLLDELPGSSTRQSLPQGIPS
jgi:HPt (histidine-containing phosphotransfer) domain-containing protein